MMLDLTIKELSRHRLRTILTILGVAIGIALVTGLSAFAEGIEGIINNEMSYLSGLITVSQEGSSWMSFQYSELDESIGEEISDLPGVERVAGIVFGSASGVGAIVGVNPTDVDMFGLDVEYKEGRAMEEDTDEVVLGSDYADETGYRTGDEIEIQGKKYEVVGVLKKTGTEEDGGVITSLKTAQDMLGKEDKVTVFVVKPVDVRNADELADEIESRFDDVQAGSDEDLRKRAENFVGQISVITFGMGSIAAIIAALGIMNVMFMSIRERRREIGTMKALGATTHQILVEIVVEAVALGIAGAVFGILFSYMAVSVVNGMLGEAGIATVTPVLIIKAFIFAIFLGVLGGVLPAREAASLQPAVVLRYE